MQDVVVADLLVADRDGTSAGRPWSFGAVSQASDSAWMRPSGNSTRYCCKGSRPKVYFTSKAASLPSGPSVSTMNLPSVAEEARAHAVIVEARIVEIAEHGLLGGVRHGVRVLRSVPELRLARCGSRRRSRCRRSSAPALNWPALSAARPAIRKAHRAAQPQARSPRRRRQRSKLRASTNCPLPASRLPGLAPQRASPLGGLASPSFAMSSCAGCAPKVFRPTRAKGAASSHATAHRRQ